MNHNKSNLKTNIPFISIRNSEGKHIFIYGKRKVLIPAEGDAHELEVSRYKLFQAIKKQNE